MADDKNIFQRMVSQENWRVTCVMECVGDLAQLFKLVFSGLDGSIHLHLPQVHGTLDGFTDIG